MSVHQNVITLSSGSGKKSFIHSHRAVGIHAQMGDERAGKMGIKMKNAANDGGGNKGIKKYTAVEHRLQNSFHIWLIYFIVKL